MNQEGVLTVRERAYILDKIGNTDYFSEEFGELDRVREEEMVVSIFRKLELTYYVPTNSKYFHLKHLNFTADQAKEAIKDLENFKQLFEDALQD